jgi:hypothetical protein
MTTVKGCVKVKETGDPMDGLVVAVFFGKMGVTSPMNKPTSAGFWKADPQSLGSAITDLNGAFEVQINPDALEKVKGSQNIRMLLAVMAPATAQTAKATTSESLRARLLHWVELPKLRPGQTEACVVRVLEKQLDGFGLVSPNRRPKDNIKRIAERRIQAEHDSEELRLRIREGLAPLRSKRIKLRRKTADAARLFASQFNAVPKKALTHANFILSRDQAEAAQQDAARDGLLTMAQGAERTASIGAVYLDDNDLSSIGVSVAPVVGRAVQVDGEQLCRLLSERRGGTELVRVHGLLEAHKAASEAADRLDGQTTGEEETADSTDEALSVEEQLEASEAARQRVLGQIKDMPLSTGSDGREFQPLTREELNALLPTVQLRAGPADTPAFHDFYSLQIAFPHVWTEAFDGELREEIEELYKLYVEINEEYGSGEFPEVELGERDDLLKFLAQLRKLDSETDEPVPEWAEQSFNCTLSEWNSLSEAQKLELLELFHEYNDPTFHPGLRKAVMHKALDLISAAAGYKTRLARLLSQVAIRINEPYAFHHFVPDTVNFGILLTYRQNWLPGPYQVGDLVATIPLAPGEKRKYTTKENVKRTRSQTELEKALASKSSEATITRRAEAEITEKAMMRSNFQMTAEGTFRFGIGEISSGTQFGIDQSQESSRIKRDFREAVLKASQEYRHDRSLEVRTTDEVTTEATTSGELINPNNELTVTYLLYELERQYRISERIHRVTPVILVAQKIPAPNEITESWLLSHEWILRRVILDDTLRPALDYLSEAFAGEEVSVQVRKAVWEKQVALVSDLEGKVKGLKEARDVLRGRLIESEEEISRLESVEEASKASRILRGIFTFGLSELAPSPGEAALADATAMQESLEKRLEYLEEYLTETQERLSSGQDALNKATNAYTRVIETQTNRRVAIDQLRVHVKENILYYMQAIWDHEPPDQRFFRLYHIMVDLPESSTRTVNLRRASEAEIEMGIPTISHAGKKYILEYDPPEPPDPENPNRKRLVEIADLDHPLGYKGNYIMFPLKECLYLTNFMMREFFDDYFGVRDPDVAANFSIEELLAYTEALIREGSLTEDQRAALQAIVMTKLKHPRRDSELVVVPTGELYMEALLGEHALLEEYKLNHRFFDMAKARAEWREVEIENLRRAFRLLKEEPDLDDPDIDENIVVKGAGDITVDTP